MIPRVHGNGFIQLEITDRTRIHVWPYKDDRLKVQQTYTGIHSHRFSFTSLILQGALLHKRYEFILGGSGKYRLWVPDKKEGLAPTEIYGDLKPTGQVLHRAGDVYTMEAGEIHEAEPYDGPAVTFMTKIPSGWEVYPPVIVILKDEKPDNDFDRDLSNDPKVLWEIIKELI